MEQEILSARRSQLIKIIQDSLSDSEPHSKAFVFRVFGTEYATEITNQLDINSIAGETTYGGYPQLACLGFALSTSIPSLDSTPKFLAGLDRLRNRTGKSLEPFSIDDVAVLGVASGLTTIRDKQYESTIDAAKKWLVPIAGKTTDMKLWSCRMRDLAGDLLDNRGRLSTLPPDDDINTMALEIILRSIWQEQFANIPVPTRDICKKILRELLISSPPYGDLERAAVWLRAIDILTDQVSDVLLPVQDLDAMAALTAVKAKLDRKAEWQAKLDLWLYFGFLVIIGIILTILTYYLGWNVMEPWITFISLAATLGIYAYFAFTQKEFAPKEIFKQRLLAYRKHFYKEAGFNLEEYERLAKKAVNTQNRR